MLKLFYSFSYAIEYSKAKFNYIELSSQNDFAKGTKMELFRHKNIPKWLRLVGMGTIALAALIGVILMQRSQLDQASELSENPKQAEKQEAQKLKLLSRSPTFGFDNVLSDWVFLNFLQYYGDDAAREKTGYSLSPQYLDIVTRLDPRFTDVYMFISSAVSYQLGKPDLAIDLMKRGTAALSPKANPKAFQVWRFMGLDQLLLQGDIPGSIHSHEMAAEWVKGTPDEDLAPLFQGTAKFLRNDPNSLTVRVFSWGSIYEQAQMVGDKQTQERAKQAIADLGGKIFERDGKTVIQPPVSKPPKKAPTQ
ncbi:MAG: hypothetical protein LH647_05040 [Leptolyngbyaceae cyanobacterium CAN_BIN12]|nr:hypothetical protein [Leptolyngbyaceae cyanobacterium CAN_BIN12]